MANNPIGFKGSVNQIGYAQISVLEAVRFKVADAASWAPTFLASADRTVRLAVGTGYGCGVKDTTDAPVDMQHAANASSSDRYDLIVSTWTWTTDGGTRTFAIIQGTAGAGVPLATVLSRNPGGVFQGVVAVVRVRPSVGTFIAADVVDMRVRGGVAGPLVTAQSLYLQLIDGALGQELLVTSTGLTYRHDGTAWVGPYGSVRPQWTSRTARTGSTDSYAPGAFANLVTGTWVGAPAGIYLVTAQMGVQAVGAAAGTARLTVGGTVIAEPRADVPADTAANYAFIEQYGHPGGDLTYRLDHNAGGSNNVTVINPSTKMIIALQGAIA